MNTELAELRRYLSAEQHRIEYWRESPKFKSSAEIQADLQPSSFIPEKPPLAPNKQSASRMLWEQLENEYQRGEPHNNALNATSGICSAFALLITVAFVSQFQSLAAGVLIGVLAAAVVAGAGFGLSWHIRQNNITSKVNSVFDDRFNVRWNELLEEHTERVRQYHEVQQHEQKTWQES